MRISFSLFIKIHRLEDWWDAVAVAVHTNPAAIAITTIEKTLRHDLITSLLGNAGRDAISAVLF